MSEVDISEILSYALSNNYDDRQAAFDKLQELLNEDMAQCLYLLCTELADPNKDPTNRYQAGIQIKNAVHAKSETQNLIKVQKWFELPEDQRNYIKNACLSALGDSEKSARMGASSAVAALGVVELSVGSWGELITILVENMSSDNLQLKQSTLETLGKICEDINPPAISSRTTEILGAIVQGADESHPVEIVRAAITAMLNSLRFVSENFEIEEQRGYIMDMIFAAYLSEDRIIRLTSMYCIICVSDNYYDYLDEYIERIYDMTNQGINGEDEDIAQSAIEVWSTIASYEAEIVKEIEDYGQTDEEYHKLIEKALDPLCPVLLQALSTQDEDDDDEEWSTAKAASACLVVMTGALNDKIVGSVMPFVNENIKSEHDNLRAAATIAFGSILEGPVSEDFRNIVGEALGLLESHLSDPSPMVRDNTAWVLGKIAESHEDCYLNEDVALTILATLMNRTEDIPRVSASCCYAIGQIIYVFKHLDCEETSPVSRCFVEIMKALIAVTKRDDAGENNLRITAFEAMNSIIESGAEDTLKSIDNLVSFYLDLLEDTFNPEMDSKVANEFQTYICSILQSIIAKLDENILEYVDNMMNILIRLLQSKQSIVFEEALGAVGCICDVLGENFYQYMDTFKHCLFEGLKCHDASYVLLSALSVVNDLCSALGSDIRHFSDDIIGILMETLQHDVSKKVRPLILGCFGDIASALMEDFTPYVPDVMRILEFASTTDVTREEEEDIEYLITLRENILTTYGLVIQCFRDSDERNQLYPYLEKLFSFIGNVFNDRDLLTSSILHGICGVLGDIGLILAKNNNELINILNRKIVKDIINEARQSQSEKTEDIANWTYKVIRRLSN